MAALVATSSSASAPASCQAAAARAATGNGRSACTMRCVAQARFTAVGRALSSQAWVARRASSSAATRHCSAMP
jgi:hypothetical protein